MQQAIDGRRVANGDVLQFIQHANTMLGSQYDEEVRQWIVNKQQQKVGTPLPLIPVPAASWIAAPQFYAQAQTLYDAQYPGIEPLITASQTGPPVRAQYVEPGEPTKPTPGTVVSIGPYLRDGEYAALPDDNMPDGYITRGPNGTYLRKRTEPTPWGVAQWYEVVK